MCFFGVEIRYLTKILVSRHQYCTYARNETFDRKSALGSGHVQRYSTGEQSNWRWNEHVCQGEVLSALTSPKVWIALYVRTHV